MWDLQTLTLEKLRTEWCPQKCVCERNKHVVCDNGHYFYRTDVCYFLHLFSLFIFLFYLIICLSKGLRYTRSELFSLFFYFLSRSFTLFFLFFCAALAGLMNLSETAFLCTEITILPRQDDNAIVQQDEVLWSFLMAMNICIQCQEDSRPTALDSFVCILQKRKRRGKRVALHTLLERKKKSNMIETAATKYNGWARPWKQD